MAVLSISVIGTTSAEGKVKALGKCRGKKNVISNLISQLYDAEYDGSKMNICHIENESLAQLFSAKIKELFPNADIKIYPSRGLCAYYGERGGLLIGCECD